MTTKKRKPDGETLSKKFPSLKRVKLIHDEQKTEDVKNEKKSSNISFSVEYLTRKGGRPENQDYYLILEKEKKFGVFGVLDGHGPEGKQCATDASKHLKQEFQHLSQQPDIEAVKKVFSSVHGKIISRQNRDSGTTATIAFISEDKILVANVGDSKALLIRGDQIKPLSLDHSLLRDDEIQRISLTRGRIVEVKGNPRLVPHLEDFTEAEILSKGLNLGMSRALGHKVLQNYGVSSEPDFETCDVMKGDIIVLATDGVCLKNEEILNLIKQNAPIDAQQCCKLLVKASESKCRDHRWTSDNITVVVIWIKEDEET